ncbi:protein tyrosine phosphatase family protein [Allocoleopsis sp.]|uniref:protein tyrosine phosphatase family protein n=1 Tax=Allocoleopsis sp. TaxID=3088169 RepID=UPI002FD0CFC4
MNTNRIEEIYNYLKLSDFVATGGQPTEGQFSLIKEAEYQVVVNLARPDSPKALLNEQAIVESLGMRYASIPVDWENPTLEDVARFFRVMEASATQPVFVHCAANMRVSAFMYLYRLIHQGMSDQQAKSDLEKIWTPNDTWQAFIQQTVEHYTKRQTGA